jgi:hypothetical protein
MQEEAESSLILVRTLRSVMQEQEESNVISSPYLEKCYARGTGGGVQSACWLVEEHDWRIVDQLW